MDRADLEAMRGRFHAAPFIAHLGLDLVELAPGRCVTRLAVQPWMAQQGGFVHAGVLATVADHTAGPAGWTLLDEGWTVLTAQLGLQLLRPAVGEQLRTVAEVVKPGRQLSYVEASVYATGPGAEKLCVRASVSLMAVRETAR